MRLLRAAIGHTGVGRARVATLAIGVERARQATIGAQRDLHDLEVVDEPAGAGADLLALQPHLGGEGAGAAQRRHVQAHLVPLVAVAEVGGPENAARLETAGAGREGACHLARLGGGLGGVVGPESHLDAARRRQRHLLVGGMHRQRVAGHVVVHAVVEIPRAAAAVRRR